MSHDGRLRTLGLQLLEHRRFNDLVLQYIKWLNRHWHWLYRGK